MNTPNWSSLMLDDEERPALDTDLEDEALTEAEDDLYWDGTEDTPNPQALHPPVDEDHMLARMTAQGQRENGCCAEGDELLDDDLYPSDRTRE